MAQPAFRAQVADARADLVRLAVGRLASAAAEAVEHLVELSRPPTPAAVRVRAARALLGSLSPLSELVDLTERIRALEERLGERGAVESWVA